MRSFSALALCALLSSCSLFRDITETATGSFRLTSVNGVTLTPQGTGQPVPTQVGTHKFCSGTLEMYVGNQFQMSLVTSNTTANCATGTVQAGTWAHIDDDITLETTSPPAYAGTIDGDVIVLVEATSEALSYRFTRLP